MPYKDPRKQAEAQERWRRQRHIALTLLKDAAEAEGRDPKAVTKKDITPAIWAEAKRIEADGKTFIFRHSHFRGPKIEHKPHQEQPPGLPFDDLHTLLEDPKHLPDELKKYEWRRVNLFIKELPAIGDVQIVASKAGLPVAVMLRRIEEGEVDHREGRVTWNAALFRKTSQAVASAMSFGILNIRKLIAHKPATEEEPVEERVDARTRLRAIEIYMKLVFPERFSGVRARISPLTGQKGSSPPDTAAGAPGAELDAMAAPSPELLDLMHNFTPGDLERAFSLLESLEG